MKTWSMTAVSAAVNIRRAAPTVVATCAVAALSALVTATAAGRNGSESIPITPIPRDQSRALKRGCHARATLVLH